jgi:serine phosphatase RsbU (regulator of sigma subunit)/Flp pilus assembly protein TadD
MKKSGTIESSIDEINRRLWNNRYSNPGGSLTESSSILAKALKSDYQKGIAYSRLNIAASSFLQSENNTALKNLAEALLWFSENQNEQGYSWALNLKGNLHESFGDYENALTFCLKAHKLSIEINDRETEAETCSQLGLIYTRLSNFNKALEYYQEALNIRSDMKDENAIASSLNRIGMIMRLTKKYDESLDYYFKSLGIRRRNNQVSSIPWTLLGIASTCEEMEKFSEALEYYQEGIKGGDKRCTLQCIMGSGRILSRMGKSEKAQERLYESLRMAQELRALSLVSEAYSALANHFELTREYEKALKNHKLYQKTRESVHSEEVQSRLRNIEISYAIEKSEHEKEIYRLRHIELKEAYYLVEEKNKYITASINYASRIQHAILPDPEEIRDLGKDCFILYLPKEIVSGDFYWFNKAHGKQIIVAGDCTGHGVPGALMSMLGISFLEEIVNDRGITDSGKILDEMKIMVQRALRQTGTREEAKDGMDIALCVIDQSINSLQYSGAYNSLYLIRNNELIEYPADRMPIGIFEKTDTDFRSNIIETYPDDIIYMFSDGYADQFGGPNYKKYNYATLKSFLLKVHQLPLAEQKQKLEKEFYDWKRENSQIDDILILGLKI